MNLWRRFADQSAGVWFRSHRNYVILGLMALLIPSTMLATQLRTDNAIERWLGDDDPTVREWDAFRERYRIRPQITAVIDDVVPEDPRIERTAALMEQLNLVEHVWTPGRLRVATGAAQTNDLDTLLVPQDDSTALWIELSAVAQRDSAKTVRMLRHVTATCDLEEEAVHLGGPLVINAALDRWGQQSLESLLPIVGFVCFSLLWLLRGSLFQSLLLTFSAAATVLVTFAVMELYGGQMNLLLIALPPLIGVLHLSVGIHLLHHFDSWREQYEHAGIVDPQAAAVAQAFQQTIVPSFLATATTVVGMLSLAVSELGPVRGFGIWSAVGLCVSFLMAYTLLPCFLLDTPFVKPVRLACRWISPRFVWTRRIVIVATLVLLTSSVPGWKQLIPDFNAIRFLPSDSQTITDYQTIEARCCGLVPVELDVDLTAIPSGQERFRILSDLGHRLEELPDVTTTLSVISFDHGRPIAEQLQRQWRSADGDHFRVSALVRSDTERELSGIVADIESTSGDMPVSVTGLVSLIDRSQRAIYTSLRDSLLLAGGLIAVMLMVLLRSVSAGLVAFIPNIGPVVVGFGVVGWTGLPLDVGTVLTASIALGVALDDSLHFLHQFRQASDQSNSVGRCVRSTWQACAWPMIQTTVVAAVGLAILSVSPFRPVAYFGLLMAVLLVLALLADLVLLPFLLTTVAGRLFTAASKNVVVSDCCQTSDNRRLSIPRPCAGNVT